jgi:type VII secretion protein EccB
VVLALLRPHGTLGSDPIVMVRESGAVYVRVGDTVHPALNLASARLIARTPAIPRLVSAATVANAKHGPLMGIPGAPGIIAATLEPEQQAWTVCDDADGKKTTVVIGPPTEQPPAPIVLVTAEQPHAPSTYLLHAGRRAAVDLRERAVVRALRLDGIVPLTISAALLDALPETTPLGAPPIPGAGEPGPAALHEFRVGEVLRVQRASDADHYVVLADGVQRIGRVAADLIRFADSYGDRAMPEVPADRIAEVPVVDTLPVTDLTAARPVGADFDGMLCARWVWHRLGQEPETTVLSPGTIPGDVRAIDLVQADGAGPRIDAVSVPAGHSLYTRAAGVAGDGLATGPRYLVTDAGVAFGIGDAEAAQALGMPPTPGGAPWPILALLPRGPELSIARASVLRDTVVGAPA